VVFKKTGVYEPGSMDDEIVIRFEPISHAEWISALDVASKGSEQ
jgi:hypothetical protein